jgi:23S rRNA (pseudouridine1915-N3)-methyltransferase
MEFKGIAQAGESRARDAETRKREEAKHLLEGEPARLIVFDERGKAMTSLEFAALIGKLRDEGTRTLTLAIGGADGMHESVRQQADRIVSFGAMTLPHQLVRVCAAEQLYRAATILSGHPYHRE